MKIVMHDPLPLDEYLAAIQDAAPSAEIVVASKENLAEELRDAEIFFGFHSPEVFRQATKLRWIQATSAGIEALLEPELVKRGLIITNASGLYASPVAETGWALTLALFRRIPTFLRQQQEHRWEVQTPGDLDGSVAGIIGLGGIGRHYGRVAAAFGMRVVAVDRHQPPQPDFVESLWTMDRLNNLLEMSDVVLVSCPLWAESRHLINHETLGQMKPTAYLVNIARGGIVEENALLEALQSGQIAGAGIDVCETEPLPAESPLWEAPNLIITPHFAGFSGQRLRRLTKLFRENLQRYQSGERLANEVDQERGYPIPA